MHGPTHGRKDNVKTVYPPQTMFAGGIIKTHVQTACESHDLNMDFCSFDNGFKQL